jgi:hypothetical protein
MIFYYEIQSVKPLLLSVVCRFDSFTKKLIKIMLHSIVTLISLYFYVIVSTPLFHQQHCFKINVT